MRYHIFRFHVLSDPASLTDTHRHGFHLDGHRLPRRRTSRQRRHEVVSVSVPTPGLKHASFSSSSVDARHWRSGISFNHKLGLKLPLPASHRRPVNVLRHPSIFHIDCNPVPFTLTVQSIVTDPALARSPFSLVVMVVHPLFGPPAVAGPARHFVGRITALTVTLSIISTLRLKPLISAVRSPACHGRDEEDHRRDRAQCDSARFVHFFLWFTHGQKRRMMMAGYGRSNAARPLVYLVLLQCCFPKRGFRWRGGSSKDDI